MSEQTMRQRVNKALIGLDPISVENRVYAGTPDINFVGGWLELKWLRSWPDKASTVVSIDHFTPQQRVWLKRRWLCGGGAWLLLQVGHEWLLFSGKMAADHVGRVTKEGLLYACTRYWPDGLEDEKLREILNDKAAAKK